MSKTLFGQAIAKFLLGVLLVGLLIFAPAGTLAFFNGWLLMGTLFIPMLMAGIVLLVKRPALLEKRLKAKETRAEQDLLVKLSGLMFIVGFLAAGFDFRFGWTTLPRSLSIGAAGVFLLAYLLYAEVLRENAYLSRIIEVQEGQKVIDTGLYSVVRHPMYSATVLLFLAMPLMLGSMISFCIFLLYLPLIAGRIRSEEALLTAELEGYAAYTQKVRYRLIPFLW